MAVYPQFFAYGTRYNAPAPYVRVDGDQHSTIVDPSGMDLRTTMNIGQWLDRVRQGLMAEVSKDDLVAELDAWNQVHRQQLRLPV